MFFTLPQLLPSREGRLGRSELKTPMDFSYILPLLVLSSREESLKLIFLDGGG